MNREMIEDLVIASEGLREAHRDIMNRTMKRFADENPTEGEVRYWIAHELKAEAPHLFPQPPQAERRDAGRAGKPPRPQPVPLSREQHQDLMKRPPAERITRYRELQQAQETQRS
jgi:hypothetical protein